MIRKGAPYDRPFVLKMFGTEVGVNSSFVALIATDLVSIAIPWLLLPPEATRPNNNGCVIFSSRTEAATK